MPPMLSAPYAGRSSSSRLQHHQRAADGAAVHRLHRPCLAGPRRRSRAALHHRQEGKLTFASQMAVWTVERIFDMGGFAVLLALSFLSPTCGASLLPRPPRRSVRPVRYCAGPGRRHGDGSQVRRYGSAVFCIGLCRIRSQALPIICARRCIASASGSRRLRGSAKRCS